MGCPLPWIRPWIDRPRCASASLPNSSLVYATAAALRRTITCRRLLLLLTRRRKWWWWWIMNANPNRVIAVLLTTSEPRHSATSHRTRRYANELRNCVARVNDIREFFLKSKATRRKRLKTDLWVHAIHSICPVGMPVDDEYIIFHNFVLTCVSDLINNLYCTSEQCAVILLHPLSLNVWSLQSRQLDV